MLLAWSGDKESISRQGLSGGRVTLSLLVKALLDTFRLPSWATLTLFLAFSESCWASKSSLDLWIPVRVSRWRAPTEIWRTDGGRRDWVFPTRLAGLQGRGSFHKSHSPCGSPHSLHCSCVLTRAASPYSSSTSSHRNSTSSWGLSILPGPFPSRAFVKFSLNAYLFLLGPCLICSGEGRSGEWAGPWAKLRNTGSKTDKS